MVISHKYRFIFIKTIKTAGSSIETFLSKICDDGDVITPQEPHPEGLEPRNWHSGNPLAKLYACSRRVRKIVDRDSFWLGATFYQHMGAPMIRKKLALISPDIWDSYYKFTFERNSWDKAVSFYFWKTRNENPRRTFAEFLQQKMLPTDFDLYSIDGNPVVNRIGRFENLADDLQSILDEIGVDVKVDLPRVKGGIRDNKKHYTEFYTPETREFVASRYQREIEMMNYKFGE